MKRLIIYILLLYIQNVACAQVITQSFRNTPMPQVLKEISERTEGYTINFMYDDLEDFLVTTTIDKKPVKEAIRQSIGFYPISMSVDDQTHIITVECTHKATRRYKGEVVDEQGHPLEYANISLLSLRDSSFLTGGVSNESGMFVIPCEEEMVLMKVSYVGYRTRFIRCKSTNIGKVQMKTSSLHLSPITISRKRINEDPEGYSVHVNQQNMLASDVLTSLANISIRNNTYRINGEEVEAIYVNGQPVLNPNEICNIPSEMISQVRVDFQPRAIYITLRRPSSGGFMGSVSLDSRHDARIDDDSNNLSGVWYSRYKGLTIYDKIDVDHTGFNGLTMQSVTLGSSASLHEGTLNTSKTQFSNRLSLTQQLSPRHSIGISYYYSNNNTTADSYSPEEYQYPDSKYYADYSSAQKANSTYYGKNKYTDHEGTIRYTGLFGRKKDISLNVMADLYSRETSSKDLSLYGAGVGTETGESPSIRLWKFSADVVLPLSDTYELKFGAAFHHFRSYFDPDRFVSNFKGAAMVLHKMDIHGTSPTTYGELNADWKRLKLNVGYDIRRNTTSNLYWFYIFNDPEYPTYDYTQWAISGHARLLYPFGKDERHNAYISYQHQLEDIPYAVMSPFISWGDAYNYSTGNPGLKAPNHHTLSAGVSLWNNSLNLSATYRIKKDDIYWQTFISRGQAIVLYTKPVNLTRSNEFSLYGEVNLHPLRFWRMKAEGQLDIRPENQTLGDEYYDKTRVHQFYSIRNTFDFGHHWSASLNGQWEPTYSIYDRTYNAMKSFYVDLRKSFCRNRLHCSLFYTLGKRRHLDRHIGDVKDCYQFYCNIKAWGFHVSWDFSRGKHVNKTSTIDGGQKYNEIKDK